MHRYRHFGSFNRTIFVFPRKTSKPDVLVLNDDGFIYKAMDIVFLVNKDNAILKSPEQVVLSKHRRPLLVNR
jgi:hypothetical protein